ncbi:MAG: serine/threonine protein kinase [Phycisphaerales bacterium]|nr:serine/threonine protein kinase [Phycisphaerales bacterium]
MPDERPLPADDHALFGFDDENAWLRRFRAAAMSENQPAGRIGPYEILGEIDRGGQGVVYRARRRGIARDVAVKRLRAGAFATDDARRRFEREIDIASTLAHPHIVRLFTIDEIDDQTVIAMEWIDGVPITDWARDRTVDEVLDAFRRVADAVHHAHLRGVIHRDLKPSNILVDGDGPHVLDFGLAKLVDGARDDDTLTEAFVGTPAWAAPEQIAGPAASVDARADIHALGLLLHHMLTGAAPYATDGTLAAAIDAVRTVTPGRPSASNPAVARDLDAIVGRCLAKAPADRYQSVAALVDDLDRLADGRPVLARPPSPAYLLRTLMRRHRIAAGAVVAFVLLAVVFASVLAIFIERTIDSQRVTAQVNRFMHESFAVAGPSREGGGDTTVLRMLDAAARRADAELADEPRVAAEVYFTIGSTYRRLWLYREAIPHLERAAALTRAVSGDDERLARILVVLGTALANSSRPDAVDVHREALAIRLAHLDADDPRVAEAKMRLGYALYHVARPRQFDEAERHLLDALATYRRASPGPHRDLASCLHNLGYMRLCQRRGADAETLYRAALDMLADLDLRDDPFYAECLHGYTGLLMGLGRHEDALVALDEAIPIVRDVYGDGWVATLHRRAAAAHDALGHFPEAVIAHRLAFLTTCAMLAVEHPDDDRTLDRLRRLVAESPPARPFPAHDALPLLRALADAPRTSLVQVLRRDASTRTRMGDEPAADALRRVIDALRET